MILNDNRKGVFIICAVTLSPFFFVTGNSSLSLLFLLPHHVYVCGLSLATTPFIAFHQPELTHFVRLCSLVENSISKS